MVLGLPYDSQPQPKCWVHMGQSKKAKSGQTSYEHPAFSCTRPQSPSDFGQGIGEVLWSCDPSLKVLCILSLSLFMHQSSFYFSLLMAGEKNILLFFFNFSVESTGTWVPNADFWALSLKQDFGTYQLCDRSLGKPFTSLSFYIPPVKQSQCHWSAQNVIQQEKGCEHLWSYWSSSTPTESRRWGAASPSSGWATMQKPGCVDERAGSGMRCRLAACFSFVFFDNANLVTLSNSYSPLLLFIPGSESFWWIQLDINQFA